MFVLSHCSLNGNRVQAVCETLLGKQLVSWKFRGNERHVSECKYVRQYKLHAGKVKGAGSLEGGPEKGNVKKNRHQFHTEIEQQKKSKWWAGG